MSSGHHLIVENTSSLFRVSNRDFPQSKDINYHGALIILGKMVYWYIMVNGKWSSMKELQQLLPCVKPY